MGYMYISVCENTSDVDLYMEKVQTNLTTIKDLKMSDIYSFSL